MRIHCQDCNIDERNAETHPETYLEGIDIFLNRLTV